MKDAVKTKRNVELLAKILYELGVFTIETMKEDSMFHCRRNQDVRTKNRFGCQFLRIKACMFFLMVITGALLTAIHAAEAQSELPADLTELTLEELMDIEVASASKKIQKMSEAAAAIFVITQEDIRRSGVTSIAEALRMAPGLQVARIDANKWAVTSRGFNGRFANKLLVLMDGRSVYTPFFSGVFWDIQDTLLEDIDRIEVIRGPGASLWGANAVNGVINIITKRAENTQGALITAGGGTEEKAFGAVRYGAAVMENIKFRLYTKYFDRDSGTTISGGDANDDWRVLRGGFRMDWQSGDHDEASLQGDIYDGNEGQTLTATALTPPFSRIVSEDVEVAGGNILARWKHIFSASSEMALQLYYDRTDHKETIVDEQRDTIDLDAQHQFVLQDRHELLWGVRYRFTWDEINNSNPISANPGEREDHLVSAFVQDDIIIAKDYLRFTLGSKVEHNDYTGFEFQPNVRLLWTPENRHSLWASVSRAVRTPSRVDHDAFAPVSVVAPSSPSNPGPFPMVLAGAGSRTFDSEELLAFELGHRILAGDLLSFDIATFYNIYDNLRTTEPDQTPLLVASPLPHQVLYYRTDNKMEGETYGVEFAVDWRPSDWWRLHATYTYLQIQLRLDEDSLDPFGEWQEGMSPRNQFSLRSSMNLGEKFDLDIWLRFVDELSAIHMDGYTTMDVRLAWKPIAGLELSVAGQNLLDDRRPGFTPEIITTLPTEAERSVYGKITWRF